MACPILGNTVTRIFFCNLTDNLRVARRPDTALRVLSERPASWWATSSGALSARPASCSLDVKRRVHVSPRFHCVRALRWILPARRRPHSDAVCDDCAYGRDARP